jgi:metallo-beta-lactamase class B
MLTRLTTLAGLLLVVGVSNAMGQAPAEEIQRHIAAARQAAGAEHGSLFNLLCPLPDEAARMEASPPGLPATPGREDWYTEPVRVFDNLLYVGQTEYSAWAIPTSEGILVIDALYDYSAEPQIADGLRKLGLDPADIEYVIVSHGHGDHVGGAAHLQEAYGARIVMSDADWELVERSTASWPKLRRDIVAHDGYEIVLGEITAHTYLTPGHTPGTISTIVGPIRDGDGRHVAAAWGGTAFNFRGSPEFPREYWLRTYGESAARFRDIAERSGADILIANHPRFDRTPTKVPALATRRAGDPHPYVVGNESIRRYLDVAEHCAAAARLAER